ncbi:Glycosyltransferase AglI [Candidatus Burarchaeum australiense]|nr:Glycosyltransferase AglI [Candidatus Burarchaeum australiense]
MKISVIIPTYNESATILATLERVIGQTRRPDEVVVVDDSTDSTPQVVGKFSKQHKAVRLVRGARRGVSAAKNLGAREAKGGILVFLDADVLLDPRSLDLIEKKFRVPGVELVQWFNPPRPPKTFMEKCNYVRISHLSGRAAGDIMEVPHAYKRETFERLGGFNESLRYFEDRDMHDRIRHAGLQVHRIEAPAQHMEPTTRGGIKKPATRLRRPR